MQALRFGHSTSGELGYQLFADGKCEEQLATAVLQLMRSLKLNPRLFGENFGWIWRRVTGQRYLFGRIQAILQDNQSVVLEVKLLVFDHGEIERFQWQPFEYASRFDERELWGKVVTPQRGGAAARSATGLSAESRANILALALGWEDSAKDAQRFLYLYINGLQLEQRRQIEFLAPECTGSSPEVHLWFAPQSGREQGPKGPPRGLLLQGLVGTIVLLVLFFVWGAVQFGKLQSELDQEREAVRRVTEEFNAFEQKTRDPEKVAIAEAEPEIDEDATVLKDIKDEIKKLFDAYCTDGIEVDRNSTEVQKVSVYLEHDQFTLPQLKNAIEAWSELEKQSANWKKKLQERHTLLQKVQSNLESVEAIVGRLSFRSQASLDSGTGWDQLKMDLKTKLDALGETLERIQNESKTDQLPVDPRSLIH